MNQERQPNYASILKFYNCYKDDHRYRCFLIQLQYIGADNFAGAFAKHCNINARCRQYLRKIQHASASKKRVLDGAKQTEVDNNGVDKDNVID